jgi:putative addiction module component (TIGR02574 family)
MPVTLQSLGLNKLSVEERLDLMDQLWLSLAAEERRQDIPEWHIHEIERRLADADANPDAVISWADVKARMEAEL